MASDNYILGSGKEKPVTRRVLHKPYPRWLYHRSLNPIVVDDEEAEKKAREKGYMRHGELNAPQPATVNNQDKTSKIDVSDSWMKEGKK